MRRLEVTKEQVAEMKELRKKGLSYKDIAKAIESEMGFSSATVYRYLNPSTRKKDKKYFRKYRHLPKIKMKFKGIIEITEAGREHLEEAKTLPMSQRPIYFPILEDLARGKPLEGLFWGFYKGITIESEKRERIRFRSILAEQIDRGYIQKVSPKKYVPIESLEFKLFRVRKLDGAYYLTTQPIPGQPWRAKEVVDDTLFSLGYEILPEGTAKTHEELVRSESSNSSYWGGVGLTISLLHETVDPFHSDILIEVHYHRRKNDAVKVARSIEESMISYARDFVRLVEPYPGSIITREQSRLLREKIKRTVLSA